MLSFLDATIDAAIAGINSVFYFLVENNSGLLPMFFCSRLLLALTNKYWKVNNYMQLSFFVYRQLLADTVALNNQLNYFVLYNCLG